MDKDEIIKKIEDSILYRMIIYGIKTERTLFFLSNPMDVLYGESGRVETSHCDENGKALGRIELSSNIPHTIEEFKIIKDPFNCKFLFERKCEGLLEKEYSEMCIEYNKKQTPIT